MKKDTIKKNHEKIIEFWLIKFYYLRSVNVRDFFVKSQLRFFCKPINYNANQLEKNIRYGYHLVSEVGQ